MNTGTSPTVKTGEELNLHPPVERAGRHGNHGDPVVMTDLLQLIHQTDIIMVMSSMER